MHWYRAARKYPSYPPSPSSESSVTMAEARTTHRLHGAKGPGLGEARAWIGDRVTDALGVGVGRLEDIWVDAETGEPSWLLIREGRFGGGAHKLVPFEGATEGGGRLWL